MPPGWTGYLERSADYISTRDSATMAFEADTTLSLRVARHRVYRYRSAGAAKGVYEDWFFLARLGKPLRIGHIRARLRINPILPAMTMKAESHTLSANGQRGTKNMS